MSHMQFTHAYNWQFSAENADNLQPLVKMSTLRSTLPCLRTQGVSPRWLRVDMATREEHRKQKIFGNRVNDTKVKLSAYREGRETLCVQQTVQTLLLYPYSTPTVHASKASTTNVDSSQTHVEERLSHRTLCVQPLKYPYQHSNGKPAPLRCAQQPIQCTQMHTHGVQIAKEGDYT